MAILLLYGINLALVGFVVVVVAYLSVLGHFIGLICTGPVPDNYFSLQAPCSLLRFLSLDDVCTSGVTLCFFTFYK